MEMIEIPCAHKVKVKTGLQQLRKDLKESLTPNSSHYDLMLPVLMGTDCC